MGILDVLPVANSMTVSEVSGAMSRSAEDWKRPADVMKGRHIIMVNVASMMGGTQRANRRTSRDL